MDLARDHESIQNYTRRAKCLQLFARYFFFLLGYHNYETNDIK